MKQNSIAKFLFFSFFTCFFSNLLLSADNSKNFSPDANANPTITFSVNPGLLGNAMQVFLEFGTCGTGQLQRETFPFSGIWANVANGSASAANPDLTYNFTPSLIGSCAYRFRAVVSGGPGCTAFTGAQPAVCLNIINPCLPPSIATPASSTSVECDGSGNTNDLNTWLANNGGATSVNGCGITTWSHNYTGLSNGCGNTGLATVTFTVTDSNGSTATTTATFSIVDTTPPLIVTPASNQNTECGSDNETALENWLFNLAGANATDDCGDEAWSYSFTLSEGCGSTASYSTIFMVFDECFNTSTTSATFTIEDTTAPSMDVEASSDTVECGEGNAAALADWLENNGGASASDECGNVSWSNDYSGMSDDCGGTGSATVIFSATDECGNTSQTSATFTIEDTTNPNALCKNIVLELGSNGSASITAGSVDNGSNDACGGVSLSISTTSFNYTNLGNNSVTLTITDDCGLQSTCTAIVKVEFPEEWMCASGNSGNCNKIIICHKATPKNKNICVSADATTIADHLGHGDYLGPCVNTNFPSCGVADMKLNTNIATNDKWTFEEHLHNGELTNSDVEAIITVAPNPFENQTTFHIEMVQTGRASLKVYNFMGQLVSVVFDVELTMGHYDYIFESGDKKDGVFLYVFNSGDKIKTGNILISRN